jgi:hypothetical protein
LHAVNARQSAAALHPQTPFTHACPTLFVLQSTQEPLLPQLCGVPAHARSGGIARSGMARSSAARSRMARLARSLVAKSRAARSGIGTEESRGGAWSLDGLVQATMLIEKTNATRRFMRLLFCSLVIREVRYDGPPVHAASRAQPTRATAREVDCPARHGGGSRQFGA